MTNEQKVKELTDQTQSHNEEKEKMYRQLKRVVCICKGISLSKFLPVLKDTDNTQDVHEKVGSGDGGCQGRRCSPRVEQLLVKSAPLRSDSDESS
ncbi:MAG: (2Fe-2S)-binding protein [Proteobacteria bacterium]|nr:(2Fe-2S)-binding protein [Pseudomonadota bacterium]